jgi:hypothetical protein
MVSVYKVSRDFQVFSNCWLLVLLFKKKCFYKWRNSKCIIKDLINHIPSCHAILSRKEITGTLQEKLRKRNITKFKDVIESYWSGVGKFQRN